MVSRVNYEKTFILITTQNSPFVKLLKYNLNFNSSQNQNSFFKFFCFSLCEMIDSQNNQLKISKESTGVLIKNKKS